MCRRAWTLTPDGIHLGGGNKVLGFLIAMVIIGVIAGYLGRLLVLGRQPAAMM